MKTVTIEQIMAWKPCQPDYPIERVTELFAGRETLTAIDILQLNIPPRDKLWTVLRKDMIDTPILHEFDCRCAEGALKLLSSPDPRSIAAIADKRAWLRKEITDDELRAARAAARVAACAARSAAYAYADADADADASAAAEAARNAASDTQCGILLEMVGGA